MALTGKVAIVTGASQGIGRAIALGLARAGAAVVVNYSSSEAAAAAVVADIEGEGGTAAAIQADISQAAAVERLFAETIARFGAVQIVVCNAGVAMRASFAETSEADFDRVFAINVKGTFLTFQAAARHLQEGGRIVYISSSATVHPQAGLAVYAASKAAPKLLVESLAQELGERQITVNSVMPGPTTPGMFDNAPESEKQAAAASSPFGRIGRAAEIADVVAFLASPEAQWITGQHILANGGAKF